jgi:hypothetical protein
VRPAAYATAAGALAGQLAVTVDQGSGTTGGVGSCTGFVVSTAGIYTGTLANLAATATDYASGRGTWTPAAGNTMTYRFTMTVPDTRRPRTPTRSPRSRGKRTPDRDGPATGRRPPRVLGDRTATGTRRVADRRLGELPRGAHGARGPSGALGLAVLHRDLGLHDAVRAPRGHRGLGTVRRRSGGCRRGAHPGAAAGSRPGRAGECSHHAPGHRRVAVRPVPDQG